jgi:hypothetical protein
MLAPLRREWTGRVSLGVNVRHQAVRRIAHAWLHVPSQAQHGGIFARLTAEAEAETVEYHSDQGNRHEENCGRKRR